MNTSIDKFDLIGYKIRCLNSTNHEIKLQENRDSYTSNVNIFCSSQLGKGKLLSTF